MWRRREGVPKINESQDQSPHELIRIGDLARRVEVRVDTLRAWERRYGLLNPDRSTGGFRLYSSDDELIVRAMLNEIHRGYPPAQAAKLALAWAKTRDGGAGRTDDARDPSSATAPVVRTHLEAIRSSLDRALVGFEGRRAHQIIDALLAEFTLNAALRDVLLPCLRQIGEGWASGAVTIAQEHFASQLVRERLLGVARDWDQGRGPRTVLACAPGERHDIGLICFGLVLSRNGWRVTFLGPDTPATALSEAAAALSPDLIVLTATVEERFTAITEPLHALATGTDLMLAGPGATPAIASATGATLLEGGPVSAALHIATRQPRSTHTG
jgi:MerR family transcriptional regulator, light-induced transcriptional regulator